MQYTQAARKSGPCARRSFQAGPSTSTSIPPQPGRSVERFCFRGAKPARTVINMDSEAGCQQAHAGHPVYEESVVAGKDGSLANAFVYIQAGLEGKLSSR